MWHAVTKMLDQYGLLLMTPIVSILQPLEAHSSPWKAFLFHATLPFLMARVALGFPVPLGLRHIVYCANIYIYAHHNVWRCPQEIATIAGRGQWYCNAIAALENAFHRWFAFPAFRHDSLNPLPSTLLSETAACVVFKTWTQVRLLLVVRDIKYGTE